MRVADFRAFVKHVACGVLRMGPAAEWGAHSARIGGATDIADSGKTSPALLQAKEQQVGE